ncbi:MAG TPA: hypothetical protein VIM99_13610, partial [Blastocatellia bacterium]
NLARTLLLPGVKDLIARKARFLSASLGALKTDVAAARKVFADWPSPIVVASEAIGGELLFPASSIENDFAWAPAHPVVDAYRAFKPMPYDAPTSAMAATLYAVRPQENYFNLSAPGTISVLDDGAAKFTKSPEGKHRYLTVEPGQEQRIIKTYIELASAKPVPRQPRFRRQQQQQQQAPPKPPIAKPPQSGF